MSAIESYQVTIKTAIKWMQELVDIERKEPLTQDTLLTIATQIKKQRVRGLHPILDKLESIRYIVNKLFDETIINSIIEEDKESKKSIKVTIRASDDPEPPESSESSDTPKSNSYNDFFKIVHPMIKSKNPTWTPQEITTEIGRQWSLIKSGSSSAPEPEPEPVPVKAEEEPKKTGRPKKTKEEPATKADDTLPVKVEEPSPSKPEETPKKTGRAKKTKEEPPETLKEIVSVAPAESQEEPLHVKRKKIPKAIRTLVWNKYIGADITAAKCLCCREEKISHTNWHCGHVLSEAKGGDSTINNLRPICAPCNSSMGTKSMNEFMEEYFGRTL